MSRTVKEHEIKTYEPLASRLRPQALEEMVGHEAIIGKASVFRQAIDQGTAGSLILWGPPGVGKTTLAFIIADKMDATVERVSAVTAGVKDLRMVIEQAKEWRKTGKRTVLIVDEIHRFNKAQQDVLLPHVEDGLLTLIGATTENPYFEVIKALVSRAEVVRLEILKDEDMEMIIDRCEAGLTGEARDALVAMAGGDARRALNILERLQLLNKSKLMPVDVAAAAQQRITQYDKQGDVHYDTISALIKSMRGSDPDAALFYLFRMLMAGEDPKYIVRRMWVFASEDIGNADPHALMLVASAAQALEWVGLPEAEYNLAQAVIYLAAAPKSNAVKKAMDKVKEDVKRHGNAVPPGHITNAPVEELKKFGKGVGYKYPHDFLEGLVAQQYRPEAVQGHVYYEPGVEGFEKEVKRRVERAREVLLGGS